MGRRIGVFLRRVRLRLWQGGGTCHGERDLAVGAGEVGAEELLADFPGGVLEVL